MNIRPETIKLLEETIGSKLLDTDPGDVVFASDPKSEDNKSKVKYVGQGQTKKLLHSKGKYQNEKATY